MALEVLNLGEEKLKCPRCGRGEKILDHKEMIVCLNCGEEFDKSDLKMFEPTNILTRSEKYGMIKVLLNEFDGDLRSL